MIVYRHFSLTCGHDKIKARALIILGQFVIAEKFRQAVDMYVNSTKNISVEKRLTDYSTITYMLFLIIKILFYKPNIEFEFIFGATNPSYIITNQINLKKIQQYQVKMVKMDNWKEYLLN